MQKKILLIISIFSFLFASNIFASSITKTPPKCPTVSALQAAGLTGYKVERDDYAILALPNAKFGTDTEWQYKIGVFDPTWDDQKIIDTTNSNLPKMTFGDGPIDFYGAWLCYYDLSDGYDAFVFVDQSGAKSAAKFNPALLKNIK